MSAFVGFPPGKTRFTPLPDLFYTDLLTQIDDMDELKVLLFMFYFLNRQRGYPRYMTRAELEAEGVLLSALKGDDGDGDDETANLIERLHLALERGVARGALLQLTISNQEGSTTYLLMNTPLGRQAVAEVQAGELILERRGAVREPHIESPRPNIFELYEQNIGLLQPLLAEELEEAAQEYPPRWIDDAFRIAVEHNVRNWRYIDAILRRWASEGKDDRGLPRRRGSRHRS